MEAEVRIIPLPDLPEDLRIDLRAGDVVVAAALNDHAVRESFGVALSTIFGSNHGEDVGNLSRYTPAAVLRQVDAYSGRGAARRVLRQAIHMTRTGQVANCDTPKVLRKLIGFKDPQRFRGIFEPVMDIPVVSVPLKRS